MLVLQESFARGSLKCHSGFTCCGSELLLGLSYPKIETYDDSSSYYVTQMSVLFDSVTSQVLADVLGASCSGSSED